MSVAGGHLALAYLPSVDQVPSQLLDRNFFGLCFNFDGDILLSPALGKVVHIDEVVMAFGLRAAPAFHRAGKMEHWFPVPGGSGLLGRFFLGKPIFVAAVVMHVVDQRDAVGLADRQQIGWRENLVVILDGQTTSNSG